MDSKSIRVFLKRFDMATIKINDVILLTCIIVLGSVLVFKGGRSIYRCYQAATWLPTPGAVTSSEKIVAGYTGYRGKINEPTYLPKITYSYVIRGVTYSSSRLRFGLRPSTDPSVAESMMKRYPVGAKVKVYFNDANPKEAVLEKDLGSGAVSNFGIGTILLAIAGFWLQKIAERRKKYKEQFPLVTRLLEELSLQIPEGNEEIRAQVWINNDQEERLNISNLNEVGILVLGSDKISLYSAKFNGERRTRHYGRSNLKAEWLGNQTFSICENYVKSYIAASNGLIALSSREQTADIYRQLGGQILQSPSGLYALEKNPASLTVLIIMAAAFIYAVTDGIFLNPLEVVGYPDNIVLLYIVPITTFSLLIYLFMICFSVPKDVSCGLTFMCSLSLIIAILPILQRIDTAQATKSMQLYDYRMLYEGNFEPVTKGLPKLKLKLSCDYWKQFEKKHTFEFLLQEGGLGMWQFDGRELDKDIDAYMKMHPKKLKSSSISN